MDCYVVLNSPRYYGSAFLYLFDIWWSASKANISSIVLNPLVVNPPIYSLNVSTLTDWVNYGLQIVSCDGDHPTCIEAPVERFGYLDTGIFQFNTTIVYKVKVGSKADFLFSGLNGYGNAVRLTNITGEGRFFEYTGGNYSCCKGWSRLASNYFPIVLNVWIIVTIQINSQGVSTWFYNGTQEAKNIVLVNNGTIIGFTGGHYVAGGGYFDRLDIYRGLIFP